MEINELAMRIEASSASAAATGGAIPAWTQPPRSVLTPLRTAGATIPGVGGESANRGSAASGAKKP
jgi:hypothetical protein